MALGSTQPLTELGTRNLPGGKGWPTLNGDNLVTDDLAAICEPITCKMWSLDISQTYGPPRPLKEITLSFFVYLLMPLNYAIH
jgi:hypothetical protein